MDGGQVAVHGWKDVVNEDATARTKEARLQKKVQTIGKASCSKTRQHERRSLDFERKN